MIWHSKSLTMDGWVNERLSTHDDSAVSLATLLFLAPSLVFWTSPMRRQLKSAPGHRLEGIPSQIQRVMYRAWLKGGSQVSWIYPPASASHFCMAYLQHSRITWPTFYTIRGRFEMVIWTWKRGIRHPKILFCWSLDASFLCHAALSEF